ncbi:hypothetical protein QBC37DRAFT_392797 [Rhypophila decipiens]|uniref:Uncharacterized protein n=1 Tax=Rhypophila decipiens TaxID=261697 RepID=A0AAN6XVH6_9PEZI|nr:hypothetical protein QBC37DRAFT_392797 [Rhypophila decipiens]
METIYEQKMESPVMITSGYQRFMVHGKNVANTGKPMAPVSPLSPADSASSQSPTSPSLTKKPSKTMRDWVKRSGSGSGRPTKHIATLSVPGHQRLPIVHLGGGRLGESDIEPAFPTGLPSRPMARNPSIQRESSADSRVTQWIDLYPEAIERMNGYDVRLTQGKHTRTVSESSTLKQTRWKFHADHHGAAPPEIDARPAPLRIPSAKKKALDEDALKGSTIGSTTTLARSDSKWKPLPILPAQQQVAAGGNHSNASKSGSGNGMPARKPLQALPAEAIQLPKRNDSTDTIARPQTPKRQATTDLVPTKKLNPIPALPPLAIYVTPPPTPDSGSDPVSKAETPAWGPPALKIDTAAGNPSLPSTICLASETVPEPHVAFELAAAEPTTLRASLVSPLTSTTTTQSDSLLSADLDDAFKITIGMMCLNELDLNLGGSTSQSPQPQSGPELVDQRTSKPAPLDASVLVTDLDSPLAYVPRLFSPRGGSPVGGVFTSALDGSVQKKSDEVKKDRQDVGSATPQSPDPATVIPSFTPTPPTSTITTAAFTTSTMGFNISASPASALASTRKSPTPISPQTNQDKSQTPPPPPTLPIPSTTTRYTRAERIWLHQHYRGEAPFLRAWGLDIKNLADREEGRVILQDLMLSEL